MPVTFRVWVKQSSLSGKLKNIRNWEGGTVEACGRECFKDEEVIYCQMWLRHQGGQEPRVICKFAMWALLVFLTSADSKWWGWGQGGVD